MSTPDSIPAKVSIKRRPALWRRIATANLELWLLLAMFAIALIVNVVLA